MGLTMPKKLTPKQEKFCVEYVKTGSATEAYRLAYDAGKMKPTSIHSNANKLIGNTEIALRVAELRAPAAKKAQITLESHLDRLAHLSEMAESANQMGAAIAAEVSRGKAVGLYVEHVKMDATVKGNVSYKANMPTRS